MNFNVFLLRIGVCFLLSFLIGLERQCRHRIVALRTNVLVSLGTFLFVCVAYGLNTNEVARIASQVISGVGFLGAGVILRDGSKIKGLNTAATLWCVAAIGVLSAVGLLVYALVGTFFVLLSNIFLRVVSKKIMKHIISKQRDVLTISIICDKTKELKVRKHISDCLSQIKLNLISFNKNLCNIKNEFVIIVECREFSKIDRFINLVIVNRYVDNIYFNMKTIQDKKVNDVENFL